METILEWQSLEHNFNRKSNDWYWILGIITLGASVLSFYFNDFLFGAFIIIAGITIGTLSYKDTGTITVKITPKGIVSGRLLYPWMSIRSFWIEDDHMHGPRILFHPSSSFTPLIVVPINEEIDLNDVRDVLLEFLEEEFLEESFLHKWFDKILAK